MFFVCRWCSWWNYKNFLENPPPSLRLQIPHVSLERKWNEEHTMYQFNCVTFGDSSLPFLASYVVKRATQDLRERKSGATQTWIKVFISMDDLIHSCKTTQEEKITNCPWRLQILDKSYECEELDNHHPSVLKEIAGRVTPHLFEFREQSQSCPWHEMEPTDR